MHGSDEQCTERGQNFYLIQYYEPLQAFLKMVMYFQ